MPASTTARALAGSRPTVIVNLDRVRAIPYLLAGVVALLAVMALAHEMLRSVRNRLHDLAILPRQERERRIAVESSQLLLVEGLGER